MHEHRLKNLGRKRRRVRRISLRTPDGNQINLLAISTLRAETLVGILLGREDQADPSGRCPRSTKRSRPHTCYVAVSRPEIYLPRGAEGSWRENLHRLAYPSPVSNHALKQSASARCAQLPKDSVSAQE